MAYESREGGLLYSSDPARMDVDAVHGLLVHAYWCKGIPRALVARALSNSTPFGVFDEGTGRLVAVARVISDKATFAYLCDVFVADDRRGEGIGKVLVKFILAHPDLQGLRRWCLLTADAHGLYERFGFENLDDPRRYMEVKGPRDMYLKPPG